MSEYYKEITLDSAAEMLRELSPWSTKINLKDFIFRGHSDDEKYKLIPNALRKDNAEELYSQAHMELYKGKQDYYNDSECMQSQVEYQVLRKFYRLADKRGLRVPISDCLRKTMAHESDLNNPLSWLTGRTPWIPDDLLEVAGLAQHYGLFTRLLDWSYDPFVAAFFAAKSKASHKGNLSIWCLNKESLGRVNDTSTDFNLRFVTPDYATNPNLHAQLGLFTHWPIIHRKGQDMGDKSNLQYIDRTPLNELILNSLNKEVERGKVHKPQGPQLLKLTLPFSESIKLYKLLNDFGYGHSKLFPGYSGVSDEIIEMGKLI